MKLWLLLATTAFAGATGKVPVVPRVTANAPLSAPVILPLGQTLPTPSLQTPTLHAFTPAPPSAPLAPALKELPVAPAAAREASQAAAAPAAPLSAAETAERPALLGLSVGAQVERAPDGQVTPESLARLDSLFEGARAPDANGIPLAGRPAAAPLASLLKALPPQGQLRHPEKLYRQFQRRRKAREASQFLSSALLLVSGGAAVTALAPVLQKIQEWSVSRAGVKLQASVAADAEELGPTAEETLIIREALEELMRRDGRKPDFTLTVYRYPGLDLRAFAGAWPGGKPHYTVSAAYARAPDLITAAAFTAVLAHEYTHGAHGHLAHTRWAAMSGWKGLILPSALAATLFAVKAAVLASPLMALPHAETIAFLALGPGLLWTAGLLAGFLLLTLAHGLLDAAVSRSLEHQADYFSAARTRHDWMIAALLHLRSLYGDGETGVFATHPSARKRIAFLRRVFERGAKP